MTIEKTSWSLSITLNINCHYDPITIAVTTAAIDSGSTGVVVAAAVLAAIVAAVLIAALITAVSGSTNSCAQW